MKDILKRVAFLFIIATLQGVWIPSSAPGEETDISVYEAKFTTCSRGINESNWKIVPQEELIAKIQLLVDHCNSNYDRIQTWNGKGRQVTLHHLLQTDPGLPPSDEKNSSKERPSYAYLDDWYQFYRDNDNDKTYVSLLNMFQYGYNDQGQRIEHDYDLVVTNIESIITPNETYMFQFRRDQPLPQVMSSADGDQGKLCVIDLPDSIQLNPFSTVFDPRCFFCSSLKPPRKRWENIESFMLPILKGEAGEEGQKVLQRQVKLYESTINGVIWYRLNYQSERFSDVYYFNGAYNFNLLYHSKFDGEREISAVLLDYTTSDNDVFVPMRALIRYGAKGGSGEDNERRQTDFRYFEIQDYDVNKPIPEKQFTIEALHLEDGAIVQNNIEERFYEYQNGELIPLAKRDENKASSNDLAIWRSPSRIIAFAVGISLVLLSFFIKKSRKEQA